MSYGPQNETFGVLLYGVKSNMGRQGESTAVGCNLVKLVGDYFLPSSSYT